MNLTSMDLHNKSVSSMLSFSPQMKTMKTSWNSSTTSMTLTTFQPINNNECYRIFNEDSFNNLNRKLLLSFLIFAFCFINASNIMLIHGLRRTNRTFSTTTKLFIFLSSSDLVTGLITCPMQVIMLSLGVQSTCLQVGIQAFFNAFTPLLSMFTLLTMSILRCISMQRPLKRTKEQHVWMWLMCQVVIALILTIWYVDISQKSNTTQSLGIFLIVVTALCVLVNGASVVINTFLHFSLSKNKPIRKNSTVTRAKQQKGATNTLLILSIILVLCYFPNGVAFGVIGYHILGRNTVKTVYRDYVPWAHIPMVLNAGINSFVYIIRNRRIKQYYKDVFLCRLQTSRYRRESMFSMQSLNNNNNNNNDI
ncbi:uncharacterized protein [Clytia hemisphaerica]|uniref:G-protein coupled receptors family 1 profile domain-containing protein n=1 Tax=Clytia hemisphaerica TaxID=252671 RepID=A0A7M5X071_9CNID